MVTKNETINRLFISVYPKLRPAISIIIAATAHIIIPRLKRVRVRVKYHISIRIHGFNVCI